MDRRKVIALSCLGAALAGIGMVLLAQVWDRGILVGAFLFGVFAFPIYAIAVAHMNDFVEPEGYVEAAGGLLLIYGIGAIAGSVLGSLAVRFLGLEMLFAYTACVHVATGAFVLYRMHRRPPAPAREHITFADALRVAQTTSNVDVLTDDDEQADRSAPVVNAE